MNAMHGVWSWSFLLRHNQYVQIEMARIVWRVCSCLHISKIHKWRKKKCQVYLGYNVNHFALAAHSWARVRQSRKLPKILLYVCYYHHWVSESYAHARLHMPKIHFVFGQSVNKGKFIERKIEANTLDDESKVDYMYRDENNKILNSIQCSWVAKRQPSLTARIQFFRVYLPFISYIIIDEVALYVSVNANHRKT